MAKQPNSELSIPRRTSHMEGVRIVNDNGDVTYITPSEAKDVIRNYIDSELYGYLDGIVGKHGSNLNKEFEKRLNPLTEKVINGLEHIEERLLHYIDSKFDKLAEDIASKLITRKFIEEVDRKVKDKLKQRGNF